MKTLLAVVQYIINLGPTVMLPIVLTIIGVAFGQGFRKAFRSGVTIGIGFVGINLVIGVLTGNLGPAAQAMVHRFGLHLTIIDVGWPAAAAISWASPVAAFIIPLGILVNLIMLVTKTTKTMDVDIWNYWHFTAAAASVYVLTGGNFVLAALGAIIYEIAVIKVADWTAPMVHEFYGYEGISLPTGSTAAYGLIGIPISTLIGKIPGIKNLKADPDSIQKRFGIFGEPMMMGLILGIILGILAGYDVAKILQIGVSMAAVMLLMPRMVKILMEGLIPISESAKEFLQKRFKNGNDINIGLDAAISVGHPSVIATALILVPITIFLAVILPGNHVLPFGDLATIPFYVAFIVGSNKGNIIHSVITGTIVMALGLYMATDMAPFHTMMAQQAHFAIPKGTSLVSSLDFGGNFLNWIVVKIFQIF
ncbi:PTS galactitol transporter subunit IIC [Thermoanaerobacterium thermosaccharolyticum]|uniref:PTS system, galactitol-specific IIC subunit n=1 Tax=Thermoanaerobacterium thermosaccharolyticum (strain ATCC 7956 / DSM 571 / NCIMB 9385 / NCA 3814 / NCTC 13789 / WDCM 00135 / 2032) TaxID=580327 RepID=D9TT01_THETC|nr:PTS galactitol transporter subunit IIC [Thermoanaerobacterium thermosaccharolyticum]ADL69399.1 PTS system, galactitol-specific IIC subunit [Thermoanaerobacterium thermosaccharolyticum DSM 571]